MTMDIPFLFDANRLFEKELSIFKAQAFINCGRNLSAYARFKSVPEDVKGVLSSSSDEFRAAWTNEFAAEALVAELALDGPGRHFPFHEVCPESHPCGEKGPAYHLFKGKAHSLALFPIAAEAPQAVEPSVGRIWVFAGASADLPSDVALEGFDVFSINLGKCHRVYVDFACSNSAPSGHSWELGGILALSFIEETKTSFNLATGWLVSGSIEGHQLRKIGLYNKLLLKSEDRYWLLPISNKADVDDTNNHLVLFYASSLGEAKVHVRGGNISVIEPNKPEKAESSPFKEVIKDKKDPKEIEMEKPQNKPTDIKAETEQTEPKIVIRLTDRRPLRIIESNWPVIMKANYSESSYEGGEQFLRSTEKTVVFVRARKGENRISYIIHGSRLVNSFEPDGGQNEWTGYAGEYIPNDSLELGEHHSERLLETINKVAKALHVNEKVLLSDLMFSQEPFDLG